jgi:hypothetical protein
MVAAEKATGERVERLGGRVLEGVIEAEAGDLALLSIRKMRSFIENPSADKGDIQALKAAQTAYSNYTRLKATKSAEEATTAMLARSLAESPDQLKHYMAVAMPSSPLTKALNPPAIESKSS